MSRDGGPGGEFWHALCLIQASRGAARDGSLGYAFEVWWAMNMTPEQRGDNRAIPILMDWEAIGDMVCHVTREMASQRQAGGGATFLPGPAICRFKSLQKACGGDALSTKSILMFGERAAS